jgi:hypothetical protein
VRGTACLTATDVAEVEQHILRFELGWAPGRVVVQDQDSIRDAQAADSVAYCCQTLLQATVVS